jgi:hypothetical protein
MVLCKYMTDAKEGPNLYRTHKEMSVNFEDNLEPC